MARVIRDTPADLISLKLGINVVNLDVFVTDKDGSTPRSNQITVTVTP